MGLRKRPQKPQAAEEQCAKQIKVGDNIGDPCSSSVLAEPPAKESGSTQAEEVCSLLPDDVLAEPQAEEIRSARPDVLAEPQAEESVASQPEELAKPKAEETRSTQPDVSTEPQAEEVHPMQPDVSAEPQAEKSDSLHIVNMFGSEASASQKFWDAMSDASDASVEDAEQPDGLQEHLANEPFEATPPMKD